jgi:L-asparaginase / beta-aspartyl-peptidase
MGTNLPDRKAAVVTHGGAGNSKRNEDGCVGAARAAAVRLGDNEPALAAAIAAVSHLEDDGRFNAGRGADLGLDGVTLECCASVMDTDGALGAAVCVRNVRNPVQLAAAIARTPHWALAGEGADRFARLMGLPEAEHDVEHARETNRKTLQALGRPEPAMPGVDNRAFPEFWNYALPWHEAMRRYGCGTVGAVVRDHQGRFAVATSTGGSAPALLGRVGDTPIVGCGFYCGPLGAIGATGIGEAIVRQLLARTVYDWIAAGRPLQEALDAGIALFDQDTDVGLIGVTADRHGSASNRRMPVAALEC